MTVVHVNDAEQRLGAHQLGFQGVASRGWALDDNLIDGQPISSKQTNSPAKPVPAARQLVSKRPGWLRLPKAILNCLARRTLVPRRLIAGGQKITA
jgi:hypothetical protein